MPLNARSQKFSRGGFSLVELLVVMAIAVILAVISIPAIPALSSGGHMNQTVVELSSILEQARGYAIAQNTYVWVAFYPQTNNTEGDSLTVAILASRDGTDPSPWTNYGSVPNGSIDLISRIKTFRQIKLSDAGTFTSQKIPALPASLTVDAANNMANNTAAFQIKLPGAPIPVTFSHIIQFRPTGEARNGSNPIDVLEFGVQPKKGSVPDPNNVAVIRVSGLTGQTLVYRP